MKVNSDLHNHFKTSSNWKQEDFDRAVDIALKRLGPGGIVGLVNFSDRRFEEFYQLKGYDRQLIGSARNAIYVPEKDILIVKGQEVPTKRGHVLSLALPFGLSLKEGLSLEDTLKESNDQNAPILADHPFHRDGVGPYILNNHHLLTHFAALETHNGEAALGVPVIPFLKTQLPYAANQKALALFARFHSQFPNLGAYASSDGHSFYEMATSQTRINQPRIENSEVLQNDLRKALQDARPKDQTTHNSYLGAADHIARLTAIAGLSKIGIKI